MTDSLESLGEITGYGMAIHSGIIHQGKPYFIGTATFDGTSVYTVNENDEIIKFKESVVFPNSMNVKMLSFAQKMFFLVNAGDSTYPGGIYHIIEDSFEMVNGINLDTGLPTPLSLTGPGYSWSLKVNEASNGRLLRDNEIYILNSSAPNHLNSYITYFNGDEAYVRSVPSGIRAQSISEMAVSGSNLYFTQNEYTDPSGTNGIYYLGSKLSTAATKIKTIASSRAEGEFDLVNTDEGLISIRFFNNLAYFEKIENGTITPVGQTSHSVVYNNGAVSLGTKLLMYDTVIYDLVSNTSSLTNFEGADFWNSSQSGIKLSSDTWLLSIDLGIGKELYTIKF